MDSIGVKLSDFLQNANDWMISLSPWASVISLILSVLIVKNINKVKKIFFLKARGPEQFDKLSDLISTINEIYADYSKRHKEATVCLTKIDALLIWYKSRVKRNIRSEIKIFKKKVKSYNLGFSKTGIEEKVLLWEMYTILVKISELIKDNYNDNKWV